MVVVRTPRRGFIAGLGSAAAWPVVARAQPAMPVVGFLGTETAGLATERVRAFLQGLSDSGYVDGRNVAIEYRWAEGQNDRLPTLAADLVQRQVTVIAANGAAALAAKSTTTKIPIVFFTGGDPVEIGLVPNLNRPGGNLTGVTDLNVEVGSKRLQLLRDLVPTAKAVALLVNPANATRAETVAREARAASGALGLQLTILHASMDNDLDPVFASTVEMGLGGLVIGPDSFFASRSQKLGALAVRHKVPTVFAYREFAAAGGLASYGSSNADLFRQVGIYTSQILGGEKAGDLPVYRSTKVELILNLKTAKTLGLEVPHSLLARADEVIE
jgi:putative tryptophan/tyrosine transport system substrate-binding protein